MLPSYAFDYAYASGYPFDGLSRQWRSLVNGLPWQERQAG
jgi:hypothetical protein